MQAISLSDFCQYLIENKMGFVAVLDNHGNRLFQSNQTGEEGADKTAMEPSALADFVTSRVKRFPAGYFKGECKSSPSSNKDAFKVAFHTLDEAQLKGAQATPPPSPLLDFESTLNRALDSQRREFELQMQIIKLQRDLADAKAAPTADTTSVAIKELGQTVGMAAMGIFSHLNPEFKPAFAQLLGVNVGEQKPAAPAESVSVFEIPSST